jgi:hypothetical protein
MLLTIGAEIICHVLAVKGCFTAVLRTLDMLAEILMLRACLALVGFVILNLKLNAEREIHSSAMNVFMSTVRSPADPSHVLLMYGLVLDVTAVFDNVRLLPLKFWKPTSPLSVSVGAQTLKRPTLLNSDTVITLSSHGQGDDWNAENEVREAKSTT